jgi:hypothetical protein
MPWAIRVSRWKARRLMQEAFGIQVRHRKKYKVTTDSNHQLPVFENQLNRQFDCCQTGLSLCLRYHIHLDTGGLAVSGNRNRLVFQKSGRLEHELTDESNTGL